MSARRIVVVSNRLPIVIEKHEGEQRIRPGSGGLVTALSPVLEKGKGLWIGWPGCAGDEFDEDLIGDFTRRHAYDLKPVFLSRDQVDRYYHGFSNETIWPLFHDLLGHCKFELENWNTYNSVNRAFAQSIQESLQPDDFLWVQDYQLIMVGSCLHTMGVTHPIAFFLHIPFPSFDLFNRLPWRQELIEALMQYDLLGFQTLRDLRNFTDCVRNLIGGVKIETKRRHCVLQYGDRVVKAGHFPISIDFEEFDSAASSEEVEQETISFRKEYTAQRMVLGLDRLDYTKGIPERFRAFERALEKYPDLRGNVSLFQLLIPSRTYVPDYQNLKGMLDQLVGRINGRFSRGGWVPIHYMYRTLSRTQLLGCYRGCDIALITPLRDGMNLVAKEYCASRIDSDGVLILSEFAGAARQLDRGALIVNPYDTEGTAETLYRAFRMPKEDQRKRMTMLRAEVKRNNVHLWVKAFIESSQESELAMIESGAEARD